jgi:hypothetical protein
MWSYRSFMDDVARQLRPFLAEVWEARQPVVARVAAEVTRLIPSYAATPSSEVWIGMTRILERIIEGDPFAPPTEEDRQAAAGTGIQGGHAGITVEDLVAAVLLGARVVETDVMRRAAAAGVPAEVRLEGASRAREWAEQAAVWAAQGITQTPGSESTTSGLAADLLAALRTGREPGTIGDRLLRLGMDPGAQHTVVVARAPRAHDGLDDVDAARLRFAQPDRAAWCRDGDALIGVLAGLPAPSSDLVVGASARATSDGLASGRAEADRASRVAAALVGPGVHTLDSLGLLVPVHEDALLRDRLARRWLDPLRREARHDLVATVHAWQLASPGSVDQVARELQVHPNTVRNRLARVDRALPGWRAPQAQAELWAALVADHSAETPNL